MIARIPGIFRTFDSPSGREHQGRFHTTVHNSLIPDEQSVCHQEAHRLVKRGEIAASKNDRKKSKRYIA